MWNRGAGSIFGFSYDPSTLIAQPTGLDYQLMSSAFSSFSDLRIRRLMHTAGFNYRLRDDVVLSSAIGYQRYDDHQPYLVDATGRFLTFTGGLNWVF